MKDKDVIVRVSGTNKEATEFLNALKEKSEAVGLLPTDQSIRKVPEKITKSALQNKKAKDMKISVSGSEDKIEEFIKLLSEEAENKLSLTNSSVNLKLEHKDDEEKE